MTERLAIIKDLRAKGATIRMIDDVAAHLDANGGYDSPVFIATVEFIIKIRQIIQSVMQQQEQNLAPQTNSVAEFTEKDLKETENVDFNAAKAGVQDDEEIAAKERSHIVEYIETVQTQRESFVEGLDKDNKPKKTKNQNRRGNALLEKISKITSVLMADKNRRSQQQQNEAVTETASRQNAARQAQAATQAATRGSALKMNLIKMKLLSSLKIGRDNTVIGKNAWEAKKADRQMNKNPKETLNKDTREGTREGLTAAKTAETKTQNKSTDGKDKKVVESSISEIIDKMVKIKQQVKKTVDAPPVEKGKFEKQHADKSPASKANSQNVSELAVKDAISKLQQSGVKTAAAPDVKMKKETDAQIAQVQANSAAATPKLQR